MGMQRYKKPDGSNIPSVNVFRSPVWLIVSDAKGWSLPTKCDTSSGLLWWCLNAGNVLLAWRSKTRNKSGDILALKSCRGLSLEARR